VLAVAAAIGLVPLLAYPLVQLAGGARFPSRSDCVPAAVEGEPANVVFGRFDDPATADRSLVQVLAVGFKGTRVLPDGCGRWRIALLNVPSVEIARQIQGEAAKVGLHPTLELASGS